MRPRRRHSSTTASRSENPVSESLAGGGMDLPMLPPTEEQPLEGFLRLENLAPDLPLGCHSTSQLDGQGCRPPSLCDDLGLGGGPPLDEGVVVPPRLEDGTLLRAVAAASPSHPRAPDADLSRRDTGSRSRGTSLGGPWVSGASGDALDGTRGLAPAPRPYASWATYSWSRSPRQFRQEPRPAASSSRSLWGIQRRRQMEHFSTPSSRHSRHRRGAPRLAGGSAGSSSHHSQRVVFTGPASG